MLMVKKYYLPLKKGKKSHYLSVEWQRLTATFHLTLMMTSAQVVKTSVTTTDNSPSQGYTHPDDQTTLLHNSVVLFPQSVPVPTVSPHIPKLNVVSLPQPSGIFCINRRI